ncbi:MAG: hypothetical protein RBR87_08980 [Bacteroidales bacterium]|jgi:hypothetical protein|nr:hypothetical protein [Bacteroidales bacterium]
MDNLKQHLSVEELAIASELIQKAEELPHDLQTHLNRCTSCKYELMMIMELSDFEMEAAQKKIRQSKNWIAAAAIGLILLAVGIYWVSLPPQNFPQKQLTQITNVTADTAALVKNSDTEEIMKTPVEKPEKVVLAQASFAPNKDLEQLVARYQSQLRSAGSSPVLVTDLGDGFHFSWEATGVFIFEVFDNEGVLLSSEETSKQSAEFQVESPGLYYFKLISEDFDLLWCGSFEVR